MKKMITLPPFDNNSYVWQGKGWKKINTYSDRNLGAPDLTGKEYLGVGEYRVYLRGNGFSIDYNVFTGVYTLNGESQNGYSVILTDETFDSNHYYSSTIQRLNENYSNYTSNYIQLSGNVSSDYLYLNNDVLKNTKIEGKIGVNGMQIIRILFNSSATYNNFQFKLQIEKGDIATPYKPSAAPLKYYLEHDSEPKTLLMKTLIVMDDNNLEKKVYTNLKQIKEKL